MLASALAVAHTSSALDPNNTTVFVGSLFNLASETTLYSLFSPFGPILSVNIPRGQDCGFVQFARKDDAARAIAEMQNCPVAGGALRLSWGRSIGEKAAARAATRAGLRWVEDVAFKGSAESTFQQFPDRLAHLLLETHPHLAVTARVYPTYATRGSLEVAVDGLIEWLTAEVSAYERKHGHTSVVLCGHSMGGLVSMDAALQLHRTTPKGREVWPCVAGILAYDTPYLGGTCPAHAVHPHVFKHQFSTYHEYANSAIKLGAILGPIGGSLAAQFTSRPSPRANAPASSSRLSTAAWVGVGTAAVAAVGTAAATAILNRVDPANEPYRWIMDHLAFVRNLWETDAMSQRLEDGIRHEIPFHCFYTRLTNRPGSIGAPAAGPLDPTVRTFILVPGADKVYARHFSPLDSSATDEIQAHISMFQAGTNTAYFHMGLDSAQLVSEWLGTRALPGTATNPIKLDLD
ncbi:hypothetical protein MOBT1_000078 [Malassezia obtusa]|uniref:RRM domain-containing protein n=1 Tax=Malassezia obtusa TaxID=76774 RepID=A0AAF0IQC5_9BASI|nr:hypothetical protein MOBT1_000078 [Malassezia obtusa]